MSSRSDFSFTLRYSSSHSAARLGCIHTPHGDIETPAFIPVGTQGSVKSLTLDECAGIGTQMFFVNTYHMAMRPGIEHVVALGGLHRFIGWNKPLITDSGGFQVFSLANSKEPESRSLKESEEGNPQSLVKISDNGVTFRSHWDGTYHTFTPRVSMEYQWKLGSDIHIAFDDCTPYPVSFEEAKRSLQRTHAWAEESLESHQRLAAENTGKYQALYGSVQGSTFAELRRDSALFISNLPFDGIAIGGVSVGESKIEMRHAIETVLPLLPEAKPRHVLGVGEIDDVFMLVEHGVDTFDCVQPTRLARTGLALVKQGELGHPFGIPISHKTYALDNRPLDENCMCHTCKTTSKAYIHHLFRTRELTGYRLVTHHNIFMMHRLVASIRQAIQQGTLAKLREEWLS